MSYLPWMKVKLIVRECQNRIDRLFVCVAMMAIVCLSSTASAQIRFEDTEIFFSTSESVPVEPPVVGEAIDATDTTNNTTTASSLCPELLDLPPQGLACIHCTEPGAYEQALVIVDILKRSCLKNVALNYLVDGTFSYDLEVIYEQIDQLVANGQKPFLTFYIMNGPGQRRWRSFKWGGFASQMSPEKLRSRIQYDARTQARYKSAVFRIEPLVRYAVLNGGEVSVVPMLEDNLSDRAFSKTVSLTRQALPNDLVYSIGRSTCASCYRGNGSRIPLGVFKESHTASSFFNHTGGIVTNDGVDYSLYDDGIAATVSLRTLAQVRNRAGAMDNVFILWSAERQGIYRQGGGWKLPNPAERTYEIPTPEEQDRLIHFLRGEGD